MHCCLIQLHADDLLCPVACSYAYGPYTAVGIDYSLLLLEISILYGFAI